MVFGEDEALFLHLINNYHVPKSKCVFPINTPEKLVYRISFQIPSIGIVWNTKVQFFYDAIGYSYRAIPIENLSAKHVVDLLEAADKAAYQKNVDYVMSVYQTLFIGFRDVLLPDSHTVPFCYQELLKHLTVYGGTSRNEKS